MHLLMPLIVPEPIERCASLKASGETKNDLRFPNVDSTWIQACPDQTSRFDRETQGWATNHYLQCVGMHAITFLQTKNTQQGRSLNLRLQ